MAVNDRRVLMSTADKPWFPDSGRAATLMSSAKVKHKPHPMWEWVYRLEEQRKVDCDVMEHCEQLLAKAI